MKKTKYIILLVFLFNFAIILNGHTYEANTEYNKQHFDILSDIAIAKDKTYSQYRRELAFKNLCDLLVKGPGSHWITIKDGFLSIIIKDSNFFYNNICEYPEAYKKWIESLDLNWRRSGKSKYPEMKSLIIKSLEAEIKKTKKSLDLKKETLKKIKSLEPDKLH